MFNPVDTLIEACVAELQDQYARDYGLLEPEYPHIVAWVARTVLGIIANSDAMYHNVEHTILVTLVGQQILHGKHIIEGGVTAADWLHYTVALLCHDIGYVRGVCREDRPGSYVIGTGEDRVDLAPGATDASLTPYHVDRGKLFVRQRFAGHPILDEARIEANIEHTRFPVPDEDDYATTDDYPGLVRAADLIGQLADPRYLCKLPGLFYEFEETGTNRHLGYKNPDDLRRGYPVFFWKVVSPFINDALRYLRVSPPGQQWIANLYSHVFQVEHDAV